MTELDVDTTHPRQPLTREAIVAAAVTLADAEGVGGVTMRKLARSIGYEVMSLYNHVANKSELLDLMVDAVAADIETPEETVEPLVAVRTIALSLRAALVRYPWAAELWLRQMPGTERSRVMEDLLRFLHHSDLSPSMAHHGFHAVNNHVIGYTMQELGMMAAVSEREDAATVYLESLSADEHPFTIAHVQQHLDGDTGSSFELVLDLIIDGIVDLSEDG